MGHVAAFLIVVLSVLPLARPVWALTDANLVELLKAGRFDEVEAHYALLKERGWKTEHGLSGPALTYDHVPIRPDILPLLDAWCAAYPRSVFAFTQRGEFYLRYAWQARGYGWGYTVSPADAETFRARAEQAGRDFEYVYTVDPTNAHAPARLVTVAMALGWDRETMETWFQRAIRADPTDILAYFTKLEYLKLKWGGSQEAMFQFAREAAAAAPPGTSIPFMLVEAHLETFHRLLDPVGLGGEIGFWIQLTADVVQGATGHLRKAPLSELAPSRRSGREADEYFRDPAVWGELEPVLTRLTEDFPSSGAMHCWFGIIAAYAGKYELANQEFASIQDFGFLSEKWTDILWDLKRAYQSLGRPAALEPAFLAWRAADPDNPSVHLELALLYDWMGDGQRATSSYETLAELSSQTIAANPEDKYAYWLAGTAYAELDQDRAAEYYRQYIALAPREPGGYGSLAAVYRRKRQWDLAQEALSKGLELDPHNPLLRNDLGTVYEQRGDLAAATGEYRRALEAKPDYVMAHHNLARAYVAQRLYGEAERVLADGLRLDPNHAPMRNSLGVLHAEQGQDDAAIREYQRAIQVNPGYAPAHYNLAQRWYAQGQLDEAIAEYEETIRCDPSNAEARYNIGFANYDLGRVEQAIEAFREFVAMDPPQYPQEVQKATKLIQELQVRRR
jgi:tetratricopeptide (TPR) repeat protein